MNSSGVKNKPPLVIGGSSSSFASHDAPWSKVSNSKKVKGGIGCNRFVGKTDIICPVFVDTLRICVAEMIQA